MEFLIRVVDKGPDVMHTKAGHVIVTMPDGHPWTKAELENPEWRIVRVPLVRVEAESFTAPDRDPNTRIGRAARKRQLLNVPALQALKQGTVVPLSRRQVLDMATP